MVPYPVIKTIYKTRFGIAVRNIVGGLIVAPDSCRIRSILRKPESTVSTFPDLEKFFRNCMILTGKKLTYCGTSAAYTLSIGNF